MDIVTTMPARWPGGYNADAVSLETGLTCRDPSLTNQDSKDEADINTIVRRFGITGEVPVTLRTPLPNAFFEGDVEYRDCLDAIRAAEKSFADLPADVRSRFQNDPSELVEFASRAENLPQLRLWGLAPQAPPEPPGAPSSSS